jgi:hypothetical protein
VRFTRPVELGPDLQMGLLIGPVAGDGLSDEDLAVAWWVHRDELMAYDRITATRPWGYWRFEIGEEMPSGGCKVQTLRLAELELLTDDELAALREKANEARLRIGTPAERLSDGTSMDQRDVELFEAVAAA